MPENIEAMLSGGNPRILGRTEQVVELVLSHPDRLDDLFACVTNPELAQVRRQARRQAAGRPYDEAMTRYAAFLRGVNVGGVNLKMADVAKVFSQAGFGNVQTILASGNVLLESRSKVAAVRKTAEAALREAFGYDAWVLAYDIGTVAAISDDYPFDREVPGHHSYVTFVSDPDVLDELAGLAPGPDEQIERGQGVIYWQVPRSKSLDATMGKTMGKKRYKSSTTTRNLRTLDKILRR